MAPWLQRVVTILTGIACFAVGHYVPEAQKPLYMAGAALVFWAIPHTADLRSLGPLPGLDAIATGLGSQSVQAGPPPITPPTNPREWPPLIAPPQSEHPTPAEGSKPPKAA